jgi:hypothetical protein
MVISAVLDLVLCYLILLIIEDTEIYERIEHGKPLVLFTASSSTSSNNEHESNDSQSDPYDDLA